MLLALADAVLADADALAELELRNVGKPASAARGEIRSAATGCGSSPARRAAWRDGGRRVPHRVHVDDAARADRSSPGSSRRGTTRC
jgi:acyl-CoA reductase-like NAD-dependent aldehyde dehydrogenase